MIFASNLQHLFLIILIIYFRISLLHLEEF